MKSVFKKTLDTWIVLIICIIGLYFLFAYLFMPRKDLGVLTGEVHIVNNNDYLRKETLSNYAVKIMANDKYLLQFYGLNVSGTYTINKKQFDKINEGKYYWFRIKFSKLDEYINGSVESVYSYNPQE